MVPTLPLLDSGIGELWSWAGELSLQDRQQVMDHLGYRWRASSAELAHYKCDFEDYMNKAADLDRQVRNRFHDQFHAYGCWAATGNKNIAALTLALLPGFQRAANPVTLGKMTEAAVCSRLLAGFFSSIECM